MRNTRKPVILIFPFDLLSHYTRSLEVAKLLRDNYTIKVQYSKRYDWLIRESGFEAFNCPHFDTEKVIKCSEKFDFSWLNYPVLENIYSHQVKTIREHEPALLIGDTAQTLRMAAEKCNVPYVSLMNGYMTKYYALRRSIPRIHYSKKYEKVIPSFIFNFIAEIVEELNFRKLHKPFAEIRRHNGLSKKKSYRDEMEGDFNFIVDLPELFPQKRLPSNYMFMGPLFYKSENNDSKQDRIINNGKKNILVTNGSTGDYTLSNLFFNPIFKNYNIIITGIGAKPADCEFISYREFINHNSLLEMIDIMVCHGGNGTIYQGLSFGIPLLCAPRIFEQEWNVQRIATLGLGEDITDIKKPDKLLKVIEKWEHKKNSPAIKSVRDLINTMQRRLYSGESGFEQKIRELIRSKN